MEIQNHTNHASSLKDIFSSRYRQDITPDVSPNLTADIASNVGKSGPVGGDKIDKNSSSHLGRIKNIHDEFLPSQEYTRIQNIKDQVAGGFKNVDSFISMAQTLKNENVISNNDMIAVDFLAKESPKLSFDAFNRIIRNDNLSMEMKGLISQLVQKLQMIDYLSKGALVA
ncbi:hypothetical protein [Helicobacter sp. 11S02596-1]|uniref:hypothetical protein n=1 Tax=Helicobacter sp. 11S02596-1 TaxID=1476194 RepID=UPI000BA6B373|nr:hypothetical protein [Helicobacter sp. 11S02596-1]PAF42487.1 hypothetical protein BJI48_06725 [Helicobacter sp. 11S02596-1]